MIKSVILLTVILLPCLVALNGSGNLWLNWCGIAYCIILYVCATCTSAGRKFAKKMYKEVEKLNECLINKMK